jgi:DnaJ-class molecular chaperone
MVDNHESNDYTCLICQGSGLSGRKPIKCECNYTSCMKCENNEGYIIHPLELCDHCCGTGNIKDALSVLNIK